jgi:hypothetical protein
MLNYTECITTLMWDIAARLPELSFIRRDRILVFARYGRTDAEGPYATCHSLNLPTSEPGYYYWRDRETRRMTRRSEWFVTKSPTVRIGGVSVEYLVSFALPRFCEQSLRRSRKEVHYPGAEPWLAKLDTIVHELYHIDPSEPGIRRIERSDGSCSSLSHGPGFFETVSRMVKTYLASRPDPAVYDFLRYSFDELTLVYVGVVATTFRNFPSFPQRYMEALAAPLKVQPHVRIEPVKRTSQPPCYTEDDLDLRQFFASSGSYSVERQPGTAPWSRRLQAVPQDGSRPTASSSCAGVERETRRRGERSS